MEGIWFCNSWSNSFIWYLIKYFEDCSVTDLKNKEGKKQKKKDGTWIYTAQWILLFQSVTLGVIYTFSDDTAFAQKDFQTPLGIVFKAWNKFFEYLYLWQILSFWEHFWLLEEARVIEN